MPAAPFVFFDLGETLVDLRPLLAELAAVLAEEFPSVAGDARGIAVEWIKRSWSEMPRAEGSPFRTELDVSTAVLSRLLRAKGLSVSQPDAEVLQRRSWERFEREASLCPGVSREWLREIQGLAAGLGIVTDADEENVSRLLSRLALRPYFGCVITSESVRAYKPNPQIYEAALKALRAEGPRSLFVSDSAVDLQGAVAAGMAAAWIPRGSGEPPADLPPGALVLPNPGALPGVLSNYRAHGRFEILPERASGVARR